MIVNKTLTILDIYELVDYLTVAGFGYKIRNGCIEVYIPEVIITFSEEYVS